MSQQTDLAGRGLEDELDRFEEEATIFLADLEEHTLKNRQDEIGKLARRMLTSFPLLVDSLWVADPQGVVTSYVYTERNDFIQKKVPQFPQDSLRLQQVFQGKSGHQLLFSLNLTRFAQEYLENFYQLPGGESFVFLKGQLVAIGVTSLSSVTTQGIKEFDQVKKDMYQGVKGIYPVTWEKDGALANGVLVNTLFLLGMRYIMQD